eukprot:4906403-Pleurochrysis_carterae.AAC.1
MQFCRFGGAGFLHVHRSFFPTARALGLSAADESKITKGPHAHTRACKRMRARRCEYAPLHANAYACLDVNTCVQANVVVFLISCVYVRATACAGNAARVFSWWRPPPPPERLMRVGGYCTTQRRSFQPFDSTQL